MNINNAPLAYIFMENVSLNKQPELLFSFKEKIFNINFQKILERLIKNDPPSKETLNILDEDGFTPFLAYIKSFTTMHDQMLVAIQKKVE
jgi:maltose-binding protein MalE